MWEQICYVAKPQSTFTLGTFSVGKLQKTSRTARSPIKRCSSGCKKLHIIEKCLGSKCPVIPSKESRKQGKFPLYPTYHNFNYKKCYFVYRTHLKMGFVISFMVYFYNS